MNIASYGWRRNLTAREAGRRRIYLSAAFFAMGDQAAAFNINRKEFRYGEGIEIICR